MGIDTVHNVETVHIRFRISGGALWYHLDQTIESWVGRYDFRSRRFSSIQDERDKHRESRYDIFPDSGFYREEGRDTTFATVLEPLDDAAFLYWISRWIGRPLILRFGRFILLTPIKLEHAERWLNRYEAGGVFFARVLPVVRHLISIPAGIVRMSFPVFSLVTILGSAISCSILAYLGHRAYLVEPELLTNPEALVHFIRGQSGGILLLVTIFAALYMLTMRLMKPGSGA